MATLLNRHWSQRLPAGLFAVSIALGLVGCVSSASPAPEGAATPSEPVVQPAEAADKPAEPTVKPAVAETSSTNPVCPAVTSCAPMIAVPPVFERITDPARVAKILNPKWVLQKPGEGGICSGQVWHYKGPTPVTLYRLQDTRDDGGFGYWWTLSPPAASAEDIRRDNVICPEWNSMSQVVMCQVKLGAVLAVGPGQSQTCGKEPGSQYCLPASPVIQVNIDPKFVENCTYAPFLAP